MATTSPDNIQYPVNSDQVAPLASHFKNLADSTQAALNTKADTADLPTLVTQLEALDYAKFDTTYTGGSTQPGMINWNDTDGTLEFQLKGGNVTLQIGQEQVVRVKNDTGATLSNGKAVYISGSNGSNLLAAYANASSETASASTIGITTEDINSNGHGYVTTFGLVRNINTAGLTEGAPVWLSTTDGGFTSTRPTAPNHSVVLGFCLRASATVGVIFVRVDNGWELDELHNVLISSPVNGQALTYDNGVWKNATPVSSLAGLSDVTLTDPAPNEVLKYNGTDWVNGTAAGGVTAAATAPDLVAAKQGDAWFDTNDGTLYVCYLDGDGTKQWVQVQANSALEGSILARLGSLESESTVYSAGLTGAVMSFARSSAPTGWLIADGSAISRTTYSELFAAIGTSFGSGDGSTTFAIPDLRGRIPVGKNAATFATLGATGGAEAHSHGNGSLAAGGTFFTAGGAVYFDYNTKSTDPYSENVRAYWPTNGSVASLNPEGSSSGIAVYGSTSSASSLPPYQVINYCIKY